MGKILCEGCKKKCRGDVLRVGEKYFHKGCFKCSVCKQNLETGGFFMRDNGFYCQDDYQKHFIAKCKVCEKDLVGEIVTVMDYSFHRECFNCTGCSATFHPGDRVTIWHDQFFCPKCIQKHSSSSVGLSNGVHVSPGTEEDDEGCVSAADASLSDPVSPPATSAPTSGAVGWSEPGDVSRSLGTQKLPLRVNDQVMATAPCTTCDELPRKSKSILRKSALNGDCSLACPPSTQEPGYLSTDSGLGERFGDPRVSGERLTVTIPEGSQNGSASHIEEGSRHQQKSPNLDQSRNSLAGRVPNSDYGRYLNHSYLNLTSVKSVVSSDKDQYRRNIANSQLNSTRKSQHFHVPAGKPRFHQTAQRVYSTLFGRSLSTMLHQVPSSTPRHSDFGNLANGLLARPDLATSAVELSRKSAKPVADYPDTCDAVTSTGSTQTSTVLDGRPGGEAVRCGGGDVFTVETKRMAAYPAGQQRDPDQVPAIERYDWPAPPASAVVLAELMRERRLRRKVGDQSASADLDDESQDALSIDYPLDEPVPGIEKTAAAYLSSSGIGQAILREEKRSSRARHQPVDPISASRSPNAAVEPSFRTRFNTHQFTCQSLRPGYTGGQLTEMRSAVVPIAAAAAASSSCSSSLALAGRSGGRTGNVDWMTSSQQGERRGTAMTASTQLSRSLHGLPSIAAQNRRLSRGSRTIGGASTTDSLAYPSVLAPPASSSVVFHKPPPPPPPKIVSYDQLRGYKRSPPKGVDVAALETHLSDDEFIRVFRLSRPVFYRLPEWKRNDLKQRAELF